MNGSVMKIWDFRETDEESYQVVVSRNGRKKKRGGGDFWERWVLLSRYSEERVESANYKEKIKLLLSSNSLEILREEMMFLYWVKALRK